MAHQSSERHWTAESVEAYQYAVASDFIAQIQEQMEMCNLRPKDIAARLDETEAYILQVFDHPGDMTLTTMIAIAQADTDGLSIVGYVAGRSTAQGPVNSKIFRACWEVAGAPCDFFELEDVLDSNTTHKVAATAGDLHD